MSLPKYIQKSRVSLEIENSKLVTQMIDLMAENAKLRASLDAFRVHGSDGCNSCDNGRITIYTKLQKCIECSNKTLNKKENK